jgi:hypothetical protein
MRRSALLILSLATAAFAAAGCATTPADGSGHVQTTQEANRENIEGPIKAPLRDLNVLRTKIPPVLLEAMPDPYKRPDTTPRMSRAAQCALLVELVKPLDEALGPDLDDPAVSGADLLETSRAAAFSAAATLASTSLIPFRSWVRLLSGAEQHDRYVQAAIMAGAVRRAYLKGLGEVRGCNPPATPSHNLTTIAAEQPPAAPEAKLKPHYPVR